MTIPNEIPDKAPSEELSIRKKNEMLRKKVEDRVKEIDALLQDPNIPGEARSQLFEEKENLEFAISEIDSNPDLPPVEPEN